MVYQQYPYYGRMFNWNMADDSHNLGIKTETQGSTMPKRGNNKQ